ncbi:hypothetical protein U1Q18_004631 [Sarracenia purpurea var. burkii]
MSACAARGACERHERIHRRRVKREERALEIVVGWREPALMARQCGVARQTTRSASANGECRSAEHCNDKQWGLKPLGIGEWEIERD